MDESEEDPRDDTVGPVPAAEPKPRGSATEGSGRPPGEEEPPRPDEVCALDGCDNPVPSPPLDEHGRRRPGRPAAYCSKAHADAASRLRRARDAPSIADPLREIRAIGERVLPPARELATALGELGKRFDAAEAGALAEVTAAREEAARALRQAEEAQRRVTLAERRRDEALARSRQDREAAARAQREADEQQRAAEQVRTQAWEEVARHERLRGQAEAARHAAEAARDELAGQVRGARDEIATLREAHNELRATLAERERALAQAVTEKLMVETRLHAAGEAREAAEAGRDAARADAGHARAEAEQARREAEQLRAEIASARADLEHAAGELSTERVARHAAEAQAGELRRSVERAEARAAQAEELAARLASRVSRDNAAGE